MLIHRSNCVDQFKYELETDGKTDIIDVLTYQSLEYRKLHNSNNQIDLSIYAYIVCDEFHYFFNDSSFNNKTAVSFQMIMNNTNAVHIFMSATGEHMRRYMRKYLKDNGMEKPIEYEVPFDFSFIKDLVFFHKDTTLEELIKDGVEKVGKEYFSFNRQKKLISFIQNIKNIVFSIAVLTIRDIMNMSIRKK